MNKQNVKSLADLRAAVVPVACLTCHDYLFVAALDATSLDMISVGDSSGMVPLWHPENSPSENYTYKD